jgi:hypothetical protein
VIHSLPLSTAGLIVIWWYRRYCHNWLCKVPGDKYDVTIARYAGHCTPVNPDQYPAPTDTDQNQFSVHTPFKACCRCCCSNLRNHSCNIHALHLTATPLALSSSLRRVCAPRKHPMRVPSQHTQEVHATHKVAQLNSHWCLSARYRSMHSTFHGCTDPAETLQRSIKPRSQQSMRTDCCSQPASQPASQPVSPASRHPSPHPYSDDTTLA